MKFRPKYRDKVRGNDFIHSSFGKLRYKHFKAFLAVYNPTVDTPDRISYNNCNICLILTWMDYIFPLVWLLGVEISADKKMMSFKGRLKDNNHIKYKAEGDGFQ